MNVAGLGTAEPPAFDLTARLPAGVTVLEASAGTGKTYAITGLAARFVAEGTPLERILLVTFTRMATGELRERVRERLLSVGRCLRQELAGAAGSAEDPVVVLLRERGREAMALASLRVDRALSDFDAATIATTHGFCQEALGGLGIAADLEPEVTFAEDLSDLVGEIVDDLYVRRFYSSSQPAFGRGQALAIAQLAVANPDAEIAAAEGEVPAMRRRLALKVREELEERKRRLSVMTYDDLLMRLRGALCGADGPAVAARLRARYDVVLVDEFQDTDPVQWEIMRTAFGAGDGALVLIADPKQAIYAFRGADVYAYLDAFGQASTRMTLGVNHRSDRQLLEAYDALFGNAMLGHQGIVYRRVRAAQTATAPRLHGAPLRVRVVERTSVQCTWNGFAQVDSARTHIAEDLAGDVAALLASEAQVTGRSGDGAPASYERVRPGHVAVLVRTNYQAALVMAALERAGIPAVINGAGSVFATDPARDWLALLEALERPASIARAHAAALTPFVGWPASEVAQAGEAAWEQLHGRLHDWALTLREHGVASLLERVTREQALAERLLARVDGERRLTDIRHIGQLLHGAASEEELGVTALAGWLRRRIVEAERESGDEERSRRLESDAEAVQVLTIHRSKGLEFPIVYAPFLWDFGRIRDGEPIAFHDEDHRRRLDVALEGSSFRRHRERFVVEQRGEDLRLAYVALTRARHQAVLWWAGSKDSGGAPLSRLLFRRQPDGSIPAEGGSTPTDAKALETLRSLATQARSRISVEVSRLGLPAAWSPAPTAAPTLAAATFARRLDRHWRRTSYSDITARAHEAFGPEAWVTSEPEQPAVSDEPDGPVAVVDRRPGDGAGDERRALATPSSLTALPVGVAAGTLVHQTLEATDFAAADLEVELGRALAAAPGRRSVSLAEPGATVAGLAAALHTPLGPLVGGLALCDVGRHDRLDELAFELPLAGGDQPASALTVPAIAAALRAGLEPGDSLYEYAAHLSDPALRQSVRGYLTGSLDLVIRLRGSDGHPRFFVLDYKTNWLAEPDEALTAWHYRPAALVEEMHQRHYGLQALLYLVALHRYLRWRVRDYEAERHLGGVLYLFVRGMAGPDTPVLGGVPCGVFGWRAPGDLVPALSDVLDRGAQR